MAAFCQWASLEFPYRHACSRLHGNLCRDRSPPDYYGSRTGSSGISPRAQHGHARGVTPDILDREGRVLATDVQASMLYAEPRKKIGDIDEAANFSWRTPGSGPDRVTRPAFLEKRFVRLKREISPQQRRKFIALHSAYRLHAEKGAYIRPERRQRTCSSVNVDNQAQQDWKMVDSGGLAELHKRALQAGVRSNPCSFPSISRSSTRCATN